MFYFIGRLILRSCNSRKSGKYFNRRWPLRYDLRLWKREFQNQRFPRRQIRNSSWPPRLCSGKQIKNSSLASDIEECLCKIFLRVFFSKLSITQFKLYLIRFWSEIFPIRIILILFIRVFRIFFKIVGMDQDWPKSFVMVFSSGLKSKTFLLELFERESKFEPYAEWDFSSSRSTFFFESRSQLCFWA